MNQNNQSNNIVFQVVHQLRTPYIRSFVLTILNVRLIGGQIHP